LALPLIIAALLSVCIVGEQHSVIRFLWPEGVSGIMISSMSYRSSDLIWINRMRNKSNQIKSGAAIHQRLSAQYRYSVCRNGVSTNGLKN
jgi:hypothetical protein